MDEGKRQEDSRSNWLLGWSFMLAICGIVTGWSANDKPNELWMIPGVIIGLISLVLVNCLGVVEAPEAEYVIKCQKLRESALLKLTDEEKSELGIE